MHILLVDDDTELTSLLTEFLRREGFTAGEWAGKIGLVLIVPPIVVGAWQVGLPVFELGAVLLVAAAVARGGPGTGLRR